MNLLVCAGAQASASPARPLPPRPFWQEHRTRRDPRVRARGVAPLPCIPQSGGPVPTSRPLQLSCCVAVGPTVHRGQTADATVPRSRHGTPRVVNPHLTSLSGTHMQCIDVYITDQHVAGGCLEVLSRSDQSAGSCSVGVGSDPRKRRGHSNRCDSPRLSRSRFSSAIMMKNWHTCAATGRGEGVSGRQARRGLGSTRGHAQPGHPCPSGPC